jgi:RND family efflux transporter MFP subunit
MIAAVLIINLILGANISLSQESTAKEAVLVEMATVEVGDISQELSLIGDIKANKKVSVFAKAPGEVVELKVDMGDRVKKDDVVAVTEHKTLELNVRQTEATLRAAQAGLEQAQMLAKIKIMSQVAQAQAGLESAQAGLAKVKDLSYAQTVSQIAQAEAGLDAIKASLKKIRAGAREEEKKQVEAAVEQAKAGLDKAKSEYERMKKLFEDENISKQTFEGIETQYTVAQAQYESALQQLKLVEEGAREEDVQAVEAQVKQAEATLELAKTLVDTRSWEKDIALAEAGLKQAQAGLSTAEAMEKAKSWEMEIITAETSVEQAKVALELAQKNLDDAFIKAPISGIISKRQIDVGDIAMTASSMATPIFEIVDMDVVKANVGVIEDDLNKVKVGNEALVKVKTITEPAKGIVTKISPTVDPSTRNATVEITIQNPEHKLKPGMFAEAEVIVEKHTSTLLAPADTVFEKDGKHYLYVVNSGKAKLTPVALGFKNKDKIEIINGVKKGDTVIVSGQIGLPDGARVQAK